MQITDGKVVAFHFTLTNEQGQIIESSADQDPLTYLHGHGNIIPGLEQALMDKVVGDTFTVALPPEEAYGVYEEDLVDTVSRSAFEGVAELEVGMQFQAQYANAHRVITITQVEGDEVTIDGNHPMAGETLTFEVEVTDVRDATEEELAHDHAHHPGDPHH